MQDVNISELNLNEVNVTRTSQMNKGKGNLCSTANIQLALRGVRSFKTGIST
jgi:hypothetical protein